MAQYLGSGRETQTKLQDAYSNESRGDEVPELVHEHEWNKDQ
jgi:hypothetical protein